MSNRVTISPATGAALDCELLEDTGERMLPETAPAAPFWEHIYRYRFAARFVRGRRVLDIACGEGYGTAALARAGAASVIGVDLSEAACEHARQRYGIDARPGSAENIPLPDRSLDLIVSFETIEHVPTPAAFLDECRRLLVPGGTLILSTPNRDAFEVIGITNSFHCSEMTRDEFLALLAPRFKRSQLYSQRLRSAGRWNVRDLSADLPVWRHNKHYWRLRHRLAGLLPHQGSLVGEVEASYRRSPVETILAQDPPFACLANPYAVMPSARFTGEEPYYYVAVART